MEQPMTGSRLEFYRNILLLLVSMLLMIGCSPDRLSSNNTELADLSIAGVSLDQFFQSAAYDYTARVGYLSRSVLVTPVVEDSNASVTVNGASSSATGSTVFLEPGANTISVVVTAANGVDQQTYTLVIGRDTLTEFAEDAYVKSFNTQAGDGFGFSVAISDNLLVIGAIGEDSGTSGINQTPDETATDAGAVYVFVRYAGSWIPEAYIKASNPEAGDGFGAKVALSGNTLAVSAPSEDSDSSGINSTPNDPSGTFNSGAVYIFVRDDDGIWTQQAYIKASNPGDSDQFGASLDLDGDTLAVGALNEDSTTSGINSTPSDTSSTYDSGAAYVFVRDAANNWSQQAYIKAANADANDQFGRVSISGDTLAVGAIGEDSDSSGINSTPNNNGTDTGAVYVFTRSNNVWSQQAYIKASNPDNLDAFGIVSLSGDSLAVGAILEDSTSTGINSTPNNSGTDSGAVYVFTRSNNVWSQQAYIKASLTGTTNDSDYFGAALAMQGDTLAVGAFFEDSSTTGIGSVGNDDGTADNSGAVYIFTRDVNGNWSQDSYLKSLNTKLADYYGASLSLSGDLLAVGVPLEDSDSFGVNDIYWDDGMTNDSGAVYIYQ